MTAPREQFEVCLLSHYDQQIATGHHALSPTVLEPICHTSQNKQMMEQVIQSFLQEIGDASHLSSTIPMLAVMNGQNVPL